MLEFFSTSFYFIPYYPNYSLHVFKSLLIILSALYSGFLNQGRPLTDTLSKTRPEPNPPVHIAALPKESTEQITSVSSISFEDYSVGARSSEEIYARLTSAYGGLGSFSAAFLGDSFIEGDILTSDLRAELQRRFGGCGVGFVPFASVSSAYNMSVSHKSTGWKFQNLNSLKTSDRTKQTIVGQYCIPAEGAYASFRGVARHNGLLRRFSSVKILFVNTKNTSITVTLNGQQSHLYKPTSSPSLQSIDLQGDITSVEVRVNNVAGFVGYGVVLSDSTGVRVDNYSVRGASGMMLTTINPTLTKEYGAQMPYDIIVLQYGLNVASHTVMSYTLYRNRMITAVNMLKEAFPSAKIIIMGIGDRCVMSAGRYVPMASIPNMIETQRDVARQTESLFWDTYTAMGGKGSIVKFVNSKPPLAARDYTHINFNGGRIVAHAFANSLLKIGAVK